MISKQLFGRTGHESTRVVFGGAALSKVTQDEADQTLEVLLRYGINHLDVAAAYGDAELRVAPWLRKHPGRFFLATKTGERKYDDAKRQIHLSLERLGVERVDLIQLHSLADPIEWDIALSPGGAIEAAVEAREQGLVRWIGVTGHGAQIAANHRRSLERFDFDSVLLPFNRITIMVFALTVVGIASLVLNKTRLGLYIRATTQNRRMAACSGIRTWQVDSYAFAFGAGIAGLGGCALSQIGNVGPDLGQNYIIDSFMVVVLGGVGQLAGTIIGAMGLGLISKVIEPFWGAVLAKIAVLVLIVLFIQKRPRGLFALKGRSVEV